MPRRVELLLELVTEGLHRARMDADRTAGISLHRPLFDGVALLLALPANHHLALTEVHGVEHYVDTQANDVAS